MFSGLAGLTVEMAEEMLSKPKEYPAFAEYVRRYATEPLFRFRPRADQVDRFDEQSAFFNSKANFSVLLGGTGAGKTEVAAAKTARYVLETPAPRRSTPFWIIGETYEMVCSVCWVEKLMRFIPPYAIFDYDWLNTKRGWPHAVILNDLHGTNTHWVLEFKSYEQGRAKFQAASIGGYWFNEEVPMSIVEEVQGRTREYSSPGWADFTPMEVRSNEWPDAYDHPPDGWEFFHVNTECNDALAEGWAERYLSMIPEDMRDTRRIGVFGAYRGQVFKEWRKSIHVVEPFEIPDDWRRIRGLDFGFNNPFVCLWIARNPDGVYYVYDEHYESSQLIQHHAAKINAKPWPKNHPCYGNTYSDHDAQVRRELHQHGVHCTPARKSVHEGIEMLRRMLIPHLTSGKCRLYVFKNCENLIREMRAYHWPDSTGVGVRERNPAELPVPFDDHAVDALRYAIFSEESAGGGKYQGPVKRREKEWQMQGQRYLGAN